MPSNRELERTTAKLEISNFISEFIFDTLPNKQNKMSRVECAIMNHDNQSGSVSTCKVYFDPYGLLLPTEMVEYFSICGMILYNTD